MYKIIFHRVDFDGIVSAAIVYDHLLKNNVKENDVMFFPYNHGDDLTNYEYYFENNDIVYVVDLSFNDFSLMYKIKERVSNFYWIDHHISGIDSYNKILSEVGCHMQIDGLRAVNFSAAALAYMYFNCDSNYHFYVNDNKLINPIELTDFVYYVSSYDIWDHSNPNTVYFQNGLNSLNKEQRKPSDGIWSKFLNLDCQFLNYYIEIGMIISNYKEQQDARSCKNQVFELEFEGYKFLAINRATDSKLFDSVWDDKYDGTLVFWYSNEKKWKLSFYAPPEKDIDLSVIAKKYGGGGHAHACGCLVDKLPFEL